MGKSLVIVESPAKAKTINKYLGKDFIVKSSIGHVRDLPVSGNKEVDPKERAKEAAKTRKLSAEAKQILKASKTQSLLVARMGINPEADWAAHYEILPGKQKVIDELKKLAESADQIYLATDLDREGEAIAWHLQEEIGGPSARFKRVVFNEITQAAIQKAFEKPGQLDLNRVNAQQTRRFLDRVVGYMVSPLLWSKVARGLSAGRVQSVAVRLVVDRERDIRAFIPEEYWEIFAQTLTVEQLPLRFQVSKCEGKPFRPINKAQTDAALAILKTLNYRITEREDKPTQSKPSAPFITSTLQQAASTRLGFSVKKTMMMAQRLYEAGYITYMRTDSTNLSQDAVNQCRQYIQAKYGARYLPKAPLTYASKKAAQEAHEAIRPSDVAISSTQLAGMERDAERLYELIWRRFVACQMVPAEYISTVISIDDKGYELKCRGRILKFDGFLKVMPVAPSEKSSGDKSEEEITLPDIKVGDVVSLQALEPKQHFTKPPARYSEASLVKELEKRGIGRPSTYASIISTIQERGYARVDNRRFYAEKMGEIVTDRLTESFTHLMDYNFTAEMEQTLDEVSEGRQQWKQVLNLFYADFKQQLNKAEQADGMRVNGPVETDIACPTCARPMQIRNASTGVFLGCSGYALPVKERCKTTMNLVAGDEAVAADGDDDDAEIRALRAKLRCDLCNTAMESYLLDSTRKIHICGNNPDCAGYKIEAGEFKIKGYEGPVIDCDKCGADMQLKTGRFGKYFGCTNPECKNTRKLLRSGQAAPPKEAPIAMPHLKCEKSDDFFLLRDGAAGIFLAASQFPKHRETRPPLVSELLTVADQLAAKFQYLLTAPVKDPQGNPTVVRFSRKTREQFVASEQDGKASGWQAFYNGSQWQAQTGSIPSETQSNDGKAATSKKAASKAGSKVSAKKVIKAKAKTGKKV
jgi:DNA topoisomerase-1